MCVCVLTKENKGYSVPSPSHSVEDALPTSQRNFCVGSVLFAGSRSRWTIAIDDDDASTKWPVDESRVVEEGRRDVQLAVPRGSGHRHRLKDEAGGRVSSGYVDFG